MYVYEHYNEIINLLTYICYEDEDAHRNDKCIFWSLSHVLLTYA